MKLIRCRVQNYKIIDDTDWVPIDRKVTALVGKNEAGKTGIMRALWKSKNVAGKKFDKLYDYPRDRYASERRATQPVTSLEFELTNEQASELASQFVPPLSVIPANVTVITSYKGERETEVRVEFTKELEDSLAAKSGLARAAIVGISTALSAHSDDPILSKASATADALLDDQAPLWSTKTVQALQGFTAAVQGWVAADPSRADDAGPERQHATELLHRAQQGDPSTKARKWVLDNIPAFIYFSDYGQLETRIHLPTFLSRRGDGSEKIRTQVALFDHSHLDPEEILSLGRARASGEADDPVQRRKEERTALLDSASFSLTGDWVDWWAEKRHKLNFAADGEDLVLRVSDEHSPFPIPFEERSQGFQWFFSFYLVFLVESAKAHKGAILLLDEPGLHLHPALQEKLIQLFDRIAEKNQLIYSTHLPFLVDGNHLERVRTVYLGGDDPQKTHVSNDVRPAGDRDTLFPIQAAVGYSIAQTLFLGKRSVIIEGITDYWLLKALNDAMVALGGYETLAGETVLIPAGGTSRLMPLASIMFSTTGVEGRQLLVLLDSDKEGRAATLRVAELFGGDSRVMLIGEAIGASSATVEDLVPRKSYLEAVKQTGKALTLTKDEEDKEPGNVAAIQKAFARLGLGEFGVAEKVATALKLIDGWGKDPKTIPAKALENGSKLFAAINKRFA